MQAAIEYTHLGYIISASLDDSCEILSKRNSSRGKINKPNVLCYLPRGQTETCTFLL